MIGVRLGMIVFAVRDARARAHALAFAGPDHRAVSHAVPMRELAIENIGNNLHVPMRVRPKPLPRLHAVLVDDPKTPKPHMGGVVIIRERKRMKRIQPTVIGVSALSGAPDLYHVVGLF